MKPIFVLLLALIAAPKEPDVPATGDLWKRLGPPKEGEWRYRFPEKGQTFAEYRAAKPVRATATRTTIYVQPYLTRVPRDRGIVDHIGAALGAFYGREVTVLKPAALPTGVYRLRRRQADVGRLVPALVRRLPADALFLLAVTDRDLFVADLPFVFGWGSMRHRVGVMSLARSTVGEKDEVWRSRTVMLAVHEAGHMLSLPHCTFYECLMNGVRTLRETDRRPPLLCPVCRAKLCWNLALDPADRYRALAGAYRGARLARVADAVERASAVSLPVK